jgi:hypothetical protein
MALEFPLSAEPIATSDPGAAGIIPFFDVSRTIISQYANSPIMRQIIADMAQNLDPQLRVDAFYAMMWNVDTAVGYGLDVWGRIVGVGRVLHLNAGTFLGFEQQSSAQSFGHGIFYHGADATTNFALTDDAYRKLILAKALANISDGSIRSINQILLNLFPDYGNSYVRDNGDMTMVYVIGAEPSPVDLAIISQSGVLPKPTGVSFSVETP